MLHPPEMKGNSSEINMGAVLITQAPEGEEEAEEEAKKRRPEGGSGPRRFRSRIEAAAATTAKAAVHLRPVEGKTPKTFFLLFGGKEKAPSEFCLKS